MASEFHTQEEPPPEVLTSPQARENPPILLIPGVCGSLLEVDNGEVAWFNETLTPYPQVAQKLMQYLYGERDPATGEFRSYVEKHGYAKVHVVEGLDGCSQLLRNRLLRLPTLKRKRIGVYFQTLVEYLGAEYGYIPGKDIFAFSYDWRQPLHAASLQTGLRATLDRIYEVTGKKCIVLGHSMGGLLVTTYMRLNPDWSRRIAKFLSMGVPYAGSGACGLISTPHGYNLRLPFRPCVARGLQAPGGSTAYLNLPSTDVRFHSCVFLRLAVPTGQLSIENYSHVRSGAPSRPAQVLKLDRTRYRDKVPEMAALMLMEVEDNPRKLTVDFEAGITLLAHYCDPNFVISPKVNYRRDVKPNIEAELSSRRSPYAQDLTGRPWHWVIYDPGMDMYPESTSQGMTDGIEEDVVDIDFGTVLKETEVHELRDLTYRATLHDQKASLRRIILRQCLSEVTEDLTLQCTTIQDTVSVLQTPVVSEPHSRTSSHTSLHIEPVVHATLDNPTLVDGKNMEQILSASNEEISDADTIDMDLEMDVEVYLQSINKAFGNYFQTTTRPPRASFQKMVLITRDMINQYKNNFKYAPVDGNPSKGVAKGSTSGRHLYTPMSTPNLEAMHTDDIHSAYTRICQSLFYETHPLPFLDLVKNSVADGTLDSLLYRPCIEYWDEAREIIKKPILFPDDPSQFRFMSINGSNLSTAIHVYYEEVFSTPLELGFTHPKFIYGNGDGTVPLASSISDPIPQAYVDDRIAYPEMGHFEMLQSPAIFEIMTSFMGLQRLPK
ncbi:putative Lecithin-cholesterol acyl transferase [Giardia muris]|uniref:Putative Lecithin-cholesterol acyl transferase n=1 Tax=Giardia muris TaxID=5742 RepID=A0A4Z1SRM2_GIAMU|nr:putative Lecithin-cholesterol acyl transferase [Giardia muris]|eukprot:TNJ28564.1 putative Lecithin-cholesterol acyl transferase [Giardia muris]